MLRSQVLCLRPPRPDDLPALAALRNDVSTQLDLLSQPRPSSPLRVQQWVEARCDDPAGVFFVIATGPDDAPAGFVQLTRMDLLHGTAELGIALVPAFRGRGLARAALALLEAYAQQVFNLRKVVLTVLADNANAVRAYERAGYRHAGVLRAHHYQAGAYRDVLLMERFLGELRP